MTIKIPENWNEVSLRKFSEIAQIDIANERLRSIEIISILTDCDPDTLKDTDPITLAEILNRLEWTKKPPSEEYKTSITVQGVEYHLVSLKSLSNGEWADLDTFCDNHTANIHKIMALLYRLPKEEYSSTVRKEREELFLDEVMTGDVFGTQVFFSLIGLKFMNNLSHYMQQSLQTTTSEESQMRTKQND